jgi:hypothetical protein
MSVENTYAVACRKLFDATQQMRDAQVKVPGTFTKGAKGRCLEKGCVFFDDCSKDIQVTLLYPKNNYSHAAGEVKPVEY